MSESLQAARAERGFAEHEHRELLPGIDRIHDIACAAGSTPVPELSLAILDVLRWVEGVLQPHAAWEEAMLYPELDRLAGTPWATRLMRFEHQQVREMADRLRTDHRRLNRDHGPEVIQGVGCHLFGLEALLRAHVEREERFLLPFLDVDLGATATAR
jgi:hemerythrin-like domain-containing protein